MGEVVEWDPGLPLVHYPAPVPELFSEQACLMLRELREQYLSVVLVPAPRPMHAGHKIRVADNRNPEWYRRLWHEHERRPRNPRRHKPTSSIKRDLVEEALERLAVVKDLRRRYDTLLRECIYDRLMTGYVDECFGEIPPAEELVAILSGAERLYVADEEEIPA